MHKNHGVLQGRRHPSKVLGASVAQIVVLLARDLAALVGIAFVLAAPLAYLLAGQWLEDFATRIDLYTASLLVIDETCDAGRAHLDILASQLGLPAPLVKALHDAQGEAG